MHQGEDTQLPLRREGGLRFIEQIHAVSLKSVLEQSEESFPMRLAMERSAAISPFHAQLINLRRHIVEAFRAQEESIAGPQHAAFEANVFMEVRMRVFGGEVKILAPAFGIETIFGGDRLQQR